MKLSVLKEVEESGEEEVCFLNLELELNGKRSKYLQFTRKLRAQKKYVLDSKTVF